MPLTVNPFSYNYSYDADTGIFDAWMQTSADRLWGFFYTNTGGKPQLKLAARGIEPEALLCDLQDSGMLSRLIFKGSDLHFGFSATIAPEELTWIRMCWILAHHDPNQLSFSFKATDSLDDRQYLTGLKTIQAQIGVPGLRLLTYFHADCGVILGSIDVAKGTHDYIAAHKLGSKICFAYNAMPESLRSVFVRKGSFHPLI